MTGYLDEIIDAVRVFDAARPRSKQTAVGWSEVGGCRRYLGYRLDGEWPSDRPDTWGAQRGTAIHEYLQLILASARPGVMVEVETMYRGIPGHADLVEKEPPTVVDIKTTKLSNSRTWQNNPAVMHQKLVQINGYAAGLIDAGMLPEDTVVRLLVVPVDGTFDDWWCFEAPFDRALADEGADRLDWVRAQQAAGEKLPKDMPLMWCQAWCEFSTICRVGDADDDEEITDPELVAAIGKYGQTSQLIGQMKKQQDGLADLIRGLHGRAGDWRISMTMPGTGREVLDEDLVRLRYNVLGEELPTTVRPGSGSRLSVTKVKGGR